MVSHNPERFPVLFTERECFSSGFVRWCRAWPGATRREEALARRSPGMAFGEWRRIREREGAIPLDVAFSSHHRRFFDAHLTASRFYGCAGRRSRRGDDFQFEAQVVSIQRLGSWHDRASRCSEARGSRRSYPLGTADAAASTGGGLPRGNGIREGRPVLSSSFLLVRATGSR